MKNTVEHAEQPRYKVRIFDFLLTLLVWLALTWTIEPVTVGVGVIVSLFGMIFLSDLFPPNMALLFAPKRLFWMILYVPYYMYFVLKANIDVAYRVIHPDLPIKPGIVRVKSGLRTDLAKTFLANSITLTPGTLSVDIEGEYFYIHWINVVTENPEKATEIIVGRFESIIRRIFE